MDIKCVGFTAGAGGSQFAGAGFTTWQHVVHAQCNYKAGFCPSRLLFHPFHASSPVCETTVALVTRRGNPKGIKDWDDLTTPGLQVTHCALLACMPTMLWSLPLVNGSTAMAWSAAADDDADAWVDDDDPTSP